MAVHVRDFVVIVRVQAVAQRIKGGLMRIDADAHVDETEATWDYIDKDDELFKPISMPTDGRDLKWCADGIELRRPVRDYLRTGATEATSQLLDVAARLEHLDELRIDVQVLFPTTFIRSRFTGHEELERVLTHSYNRWIAERSALSNGRLRWVAVLPLHNMDEAVNELKWAKEHGAVGVFKKGVECEGRGIADPYFFPLYEAASALDIPICVHTGSEGRSQLSPAALDAVQAFLPIVTSGLVDRFPTLRFGIIEAGVSWVPFLLTNIAARSRGEHMQGITLDNVLSVDVNLLRDSNIFVACQSHEDLAYVMQFGLEDNLIVGTDYTHADQSAELKALDFVEESGQSGVISAEIATKILDDNPRRFFGL